MRRLSALVATLLLLASCGAGSKSDVASAEGDTITLRHARYLTMVDYGSYMKAILYNPWDTTRVLQTYMLVPRDRALPEGMPQGTVVRVPIERSVVYTSTHCSLICELGAMQAITGICDASYIRHSELSQRLKSGQVADCGISMTPNIERILMLKPDALLLSAYEDSGDHNKVAQTGIPIIDCTDYMESSPLARAEWMRFYGRLYGKAELADSLFTTTEQAYNAIKARTSNVASRPKVLTDLIYGQSWNMPGAYSTTGVLIEDAGGSNPFDCYKQSGSVRLAPEEVLYRAADADIWLIRYAQDMPLTLSQLAQDNNTYTRLKAFATGNVYGCNASVASIFDDAGFHPHWILAEYANILHPELGIECGQHYYSKISQ